MIHWIKRHDSLPDLEVDIHDRDGNVVQLAGVNVRVLCRDARNPSQGLVWEGVGEGGSDLPNLVYRFREDGSDTARAGLFYLEYEATFPSGRVQTFPTYGFDILMVTGDLG